ncbi:flavin reductase family protein [Dasania marina]|uniref:flavin reductase family protein n=1 Tax=Dasania marina TaxID=471499 RepID=UPI0004BBE15B|nr:flavin reductase family protein [Dasania marina]
MSLDLREFRDALGSFATGVCVVTAHPEGFEPFGMTVNSFAALSLEPSLVLWSLQNSSDCYAAFEKADHYTINVLSDSQRDLSNYYAKRDQHTLLDEHYRIGKTGSPILRGAVSSLECKIWARYPGGDHIILVGEVLEMDYRRNEEPLVFHAGKYGTIR